MKQKQSFMDKPIYFLSVGGCFKLFKWQNGFILVDSKNTLIKRHE